MLLSKNTALEPVRCTSVPSLNCRRTQLVLTGTVKAECNNNADENDYTQHCGRFVAIMPLIAGTFNESNVAERMHTD